VRGTPTGVTASMARGGPGAPAARGGRKRAQRNTLASSGMRSCRSPVRTPPAWWRRAAPGRLFTRVESMLDAVLDNRWRPLIGIVLADRAGELRRCLAVPVFEGTDEMTGVANCQRASDFGDGGPFARRCEFEPGTFQPLAADVSRDGLLRGGERPVQRADRDVEFTRGTSG